jgi:ankyrin repeat protein
MVKKNNFLRRGRGIVKKIFISVCCVSLNILNNCSASQSLCDWDSCVCKINHNDNYRKKVLEKAFNAAYKKWVDAAKSEGKSVLHYAIDLLEKASDSMELDVLIESVKYIVIRDGCLLYEKINEKLPIFYLYEKYIDKPFVSSLIKFFCDNGDKTGWTLLHYAVKTENEALVKFLLQYNADIDAVTEQDITPLHIACCLGNVEIFDLLMNLKVNSNVCDKTKATPLHYVTGKTLSIKTDSCSFEINPFEILNKNDNRVREHQLRIREHMIERLMIYNKEIDCMQKDDFGFSAFDYAEKYDYVNLSKSMSRLNKIFRFSENFSNSNNNDQTKINNMQYKAEPHSEFNVWVDVATTAEIPLLKYVFSIFENCKGLDQFDVCCDGLEYILKLYPDKIEELIEEKEPIFYAIKKYRDEYWIRSVVEILLKNGANPDSCDSDGWSILHAAIKARHFELFKTIANYHADLMVSTKKEKISLLHLACFYGNKEIFDYLLEHRVDVFFADANDDTAFHFVMGCGYYDKSHEYIQFFPAASKVNVKNQKFYNEQIVIRKYMISKLKQEDVPFLQDDKSDLTAKDYADAFGHNELLNYLQ